MTDREKEIVASFKPWVAAFKRDDAEGMRAAAEAWYPAEPIPKEAKPTQANLRNSEMAALYRDGKATVHDLASRYNLSPYTVASYLSAKGLYVPVVLAESM